MKKLQVIAQYARLLYFILYPLSQLHAHVRTRKHAHTRTFASSLRKLIRAFFPIKSAY